MSDRQNTDDAGKARIGAARVRALGDEDPAEAALLDLTPAARVEMVAELSRRMWELTGRPLPRYSRSEMPVRVVEER